MNTLPVVIRLLPGGRQQFIINQRCDMHRQ